MDAADKQESPKMNRYYRLARAAAEYTIPESWAWDDAEVSDLEYGCQVWPMAWQVAPGHNGREYGIDAYDVVLVIDTPDNWCGDSPDGVAIDHEEIAVVRAADRHALATYVAELHEQYDLDSIDEIEEEIAAWLETHAVACSWHTGDTLIIHGIAHLYCAIISDAHLVLAHQSLKQKQSGKAS